jgi:hypothetical protein
MKRRRRRDVLGLEMRGGTARLFRSALDRICEFCRLGTAWPSGEVN